MLTKYLHNHVLECVINSPQKNQRKTSSRIDSHIRSEVHMKSYVLIQKMYTINNIEANDHEGLMIVQPRYTKLSNYCGPQYSSTTHATSHNEN
jgi:hypothetical protein